MAFKETVEKWFKTGFKPTEAHFYTFFNFIRWKDEKVPTEDVQYLNELLTAKADRKAFDIHLENEIKHITAEERSLWNSTISFNLSYTPAVLNYKYFDKKVFGILIIPPKKKDKEYLITHNLNIEKYLSLEVRENGLPFKNPKMKAREDLTQLVYSGRESEIGNSYISNTPIGESLKGNLILTENAIKIRSNYEFPINKLLYIEYTKKSNKFK